MLTTEVKQKDDGHTVLSQDRYGRQHLSGHGLWRSSKRILSFWLMTPASREGDVSVSMVETRKAKVAKGQAARVAVWMGPASISDGMNSATAVEQH